MSYSLINFENFHFLAFMTLFCHSGSLCAGLRIAEFKFDAFMNRVGCVEEI